MAQLKVIKGINVFIETEKEIRLAYPEKPYEEVLHTRPKVTY